MQENILGTAPIPKLMVKFAVPSIIAMLVGAIYNIVDQLFIGNFVSTLGNAATNVVFPLTSACIAIALLFGTGGASCFNLDMGKGDTKKAPYYIGNSVTAMIVGGVLLSAFVLIFLTPILKFLAATDDIMPYAKDYLWVTALGFPFLIFFQNKCFHIYFCNIFNKFILNISFSALVFDIITPLYVGSSVLCPSDNISSGVIVSSKTIFLAS